MKLAVVILNWNGLPLLQQFLPSVVEHTAGHSLYVVDNASTDGSVEWLQTYHPDISIIKHSENLGYAGGYNLALSQIQEDVLCLLNSDVAVSSNWCVPILQAFEHDPLLGAVQPKILDYNNNDRFEYAGACGGLMDQLGYPYCRGRVFNYLEMDHGQYDDELDIDWASGACLFVRREAFEESGGFDEDYFAHQEEIDLCWRLRRLDYKVKVVPDAQVYHVGGGTLKAVNPQKTFLNFRNSLFTVVKNDQRKLWWLVILGRLVLDGFAAVLFIATLKPMHAIAILRAHFSFYPQLASFLRKRQKLSKSFSKPIDNQGVKSIVFSYYMLGRRRFIDA